MHIRMSWVTSGEKLMSWNRRQKDSKSNQKFLNNFKHFFHKFQKTFKYFHKFLVRGLREFEGLLKIYENILT